MASASILACVATAAPETVPVMVGDEIDGEVRVLLVNVSVPANDAMVALKSGNVITRVCPAVMLAPLN